MRSARILALLILLSGLTLPASAQPVVATAPGPGKNFMFYFASGGGPPLPPPVMIPPMMMGLQAAHLSADQQKQVNQILQKNRAQSISLIEQLRSIHEQIADKLLAPGSVTSDTLVPLEKQAAQLDARIQQQALNAAVQIRGLLTPDQIARMAQFHQKMAALQAQMKSLMSEASGPVPAPPP